MFWMCVLSEIHRLRSILLSGITTLYLQQSYIKQNYNFTTLKPHKNRGGTMS